MHQILFFNRTCDSLLDKIPFHLYFLSSGSISFEKSFLKAYLSNPEMILTQIRLLAWVVIIEANIWLTNIFFNYELWTVKFSFYLSRLQMMFKYIWSDNALPASSYHISSNFFAVYAKHFFLVVVQNWKFQQLIVAKSTKGRIETEEGRRKFTIAVWVSTF